MGGAASSTAQAVTAGPESYDEAQVKSLFGDSFDQATFDAKKSVDGTISKEDLLLALKENALKENAAPDTPGAAAADTTPAAASADSPPAAAPADTKVAVMYAPNETTVEADILHSLIRWNKPEKRADLEALLKSEPGAVHARDTRNGNYAIHIAAQNGFVELCKLLIETYKHDPNKQNAAGQTALHMARSYDEHDTAAYMLSAGADPTLKNADGHEADSGLEGKKPKHVRDLEAATTTEHLLAAFAAVSAAAGAGNKMDTATYVKLGMGKKKEHKAAWTDDVQTAFKTGMQAL